MKATSTKIKLTAKPSSPSKKSGEANYFPVVAIGASAGGLEAMMELLKHLPADTGMAFIYVQHLSPDHKSMLTEILSKKTTMVVQEIDDMDKIKPNNVFVIPYNKGIEVTDGHIKLIPRSESSAAISIDILFSSLAEAQKERVIGIVLSGSASDGTLGMKAIKEYGGLTFAQDDTAKFTSMPHSAIAAGVVDFILPPKEIALELARLSKHPLINTTELKNGEEDLIDNSNPDLKVILDLLYKSAGVDFSAYKMNTIKRRIIRRMSLYKITLLNEYAKLLSQKTEEIDILYQDLLINVTSFFRDTDTHKYLKETLFPKLLKRKKAGESLRIWVPACATGEEAYSIAMMLLEIQESKATNTPIQIFATDLSVQAINKARIGQYSIQELETVSPKRIQRFFTKADGGFRVNKALRDMCVFAPHNILHDPPFSRLDFISCCNLFIYFDNSAQKKAVNTFHYALNEDGFLMLGKSENISQSANLFTGFNKKYKIFSRKINSGTRTLPALLPRYAQQLLTEKNSTVPTKNKTKQRPNGNAINQNGLDNAIDALLVSEFMPASVVVNYQMEIVQFRGNTDLFLTHPKGKATFNILKMARPEIVFELRNAISKVVKTKQRFRKSGIEMNAANSDTVVKIMSLEIVPLKIESEEPLLLVLFTEHEQTETFFSNPLSGEKGASLVKDRRIKKLEQELAAAHADALETAQEQESFAEELQSANEEVVSSNEELQTLNEELETSKEEIESANEELTTTNQELQTRNDLLNEAYEFSEAIISTMHEPMLVLGKDLRVKSANRAFYTQFATKEKDTEGVLVYELGNKQWDIPKLRELLETIIPNKTHFLDFEVECTFETIGKKIMLLNASRIIQKTHHEQLILLSIADLTEVRKLVLEKEIAEKKILQQQIETEQKLKEISEKKQKQLQSIFLNAPACIAVLEGSEHRYILANPAYEKLTNRKAENLLGKRISEVFPELIGTSSIELFDSIFETGESYNAPEYAVMLDLKKDGVVRQYYFNFSMEPLKNDSGKIYAVMGLCYDITEQVEARKKIEESEKKFQAAILAVEGVIWTNNAKGEMSGEQSGWAKLTGQRFKDYQGFGWAKALHPEDAQPSLDAWNKAVANISTFEFEHRIKTKKNGWKLFSVKAVPVIDENGIVLEWVGVHTDISEQRETSKKIAESEKKQALLLKVSDAIRPLSNPADIEAAVTKIALDCMGADWCHYATIEGDNLIIQRDASRGELSSLAGVYPISSFALFKAVLEAGRPFVVDDVQTTKILDEELKQLCISLQTVSFIIVPIIKTKKPVGLLSTVQSKPRKWTEVEVQLSIETAERTWAAVERAKVEEALSKSEEKYRTLFTSIDQGFALCELVRNKSGKGIDFSVLEVNHTYEKQSGINMEIMIGKTILQVFPTIDKWWIETYTAVVDNQRHAEFEKYFENTNRWFEISAYPGEKDKFFILFSDITERKQVDEKIKESEENFRQLAELMPQKISQADATGNVFFYNQNWLSYSGLSIEELKNNGWEKMMHADEREEIAKRWKHSIKTGSNLEMEIRLLNKDGKYKWHLSRATAIKDDKGNIVQWIGSATEIQKQMEQRAELEKAVGRRTNELLQANQVLVKMNIELEAFTYISSHDLQEPLRKIQTFAGRILEKEYEKLSESGKNYFRLVQIETQRMKTLIQDLLAFSKLNSADIKFVNTDINTIIEEVRNDFKDTIAEKQAVIEVKGACEVDIIPFQFRQLVQNLVSNALKFSNPKTPPHIKIESQYVAYNKLDIGRLNDKDGQAIIPLKKEHCHISITDNGIGFEKEFSKKIFEVFQRLHGKEVYTGTGIGLAIVKKIVDNHKGVITVTSELKKGTTFNIYLPTNQADMPA